MTTTVTATEFGLLANHPLEEQIAVSVPKGLITDEGQDEIRNYLARIPTGKCSYCRMNIEQVGVDPDNGGPCCKCEDVCGYSYPSYLPGLPNDWEWVSVVTGKGEYVGSFTKRVAKYYRQKHGFKFTSDQLGALGSLVGSHVNKLSEYVIDFTDTFDWSAGDFGDDGSCFWSCNADAKGALMDDGAYAVRFWKPCECSSPYCEKELKGFARAWLIPRGNCLVVMNGYGLETYTIARILAQHWNLSYRRIDLCNHGKTQGLIYINGGKGIIIGAEEDVAGQRELDLEIDYEGRVLCDRCEEYIPGETYVIEGYGTVCESCSEDFSRCDACDGMYQDDDLFEVAAHDDEYRTNSYVCSECRQQDYTECEACRRYVRNEDVTDVQCDNLCSTCLEAKGGDVECPDCEDRYLGADMIDIGGVLYCSGCAKDYECDQCGRPLPDEEYADCKTTVCNECDEDPMWLPLPEETPILDYLEKQETVDIPVDEGIAATIREAFEESRRDAVRRMEEMIWSSNPFPAPSAIYHMTTS
jgi:hypothetical protein